MLDYPVNLLICVVFLIVMVITTLIVYMGRSFADGDSKRALTVALEANLSAIVFGLYWLISTLYTHFK
jgi:hypothetical protein